MKVKKPKGLAALKLSDPARFAEIVSRGGSASGANFKNNKDRAKEAGRKGGLAPRKVINEN